MNDNGTNPPHRVLLINDDTRIRRSSAQVLLLSGYRVDATEDGEAGWEALNNNRYDLLITGNDMPKLSGVGLLEKMHDARIALPVIMVTGTPPSQEFARYPWPKPVARLPEQFTGDELLGTVKKVLHATDSARAQIKPLPIWRRTISRWFKALMISFKET